MANAQIRDEPPVSDGLPTPRRYAAIAALSLGTALVMIDGSIATVAVPTIARELGVTDGEAVLVVTTYQLILVAMLLPLSAVGDRLGHRRLYRYGLSVFLLTSVLCLWADSLAALLALRICQAFAAGAVMSVTAAMLRAIYPARALGSGLAINTLTVSSAGIVAPLLGGLVLGVAPWPYVFAAAAPFALLSLLASPALPEPAPRRTAFSFGAALLSAGTFGFIIGGLQLAIQGAPESLVAALISSGLLLAVVFVRHQLRQADPIMPVDLLGTPQFALSVAASLAGFSAVMVLLVSTPFWLQQGLGFSPTEVGAVIGWWPLTMLLVGPLAGIMSDRIPAGLLGGIGMLIATAAFLSFLLLPQHPGFWDIALRIALCGIGFGLFFSPNSRLMLGSSPAERAASVGGLIATTRLTGQTLGATIAGGLLSVGLGRGPVPAVVAAGLATVAGLCSIARLQPNFRGPRRDIA